MLNKMLARVESFKHEAHSILSQHETAPSRVVILDETYGKLTGLSIQQDELIRQALRCVENQLFRAAHILTWVAFIDFISDILASDGFVKLRQARPNWTVSSKASLHDSYPEYQIVESCKLVGLINNSEMRDIHGLLSRRNQCAHPSRFFPGYNQSLGYISSILDYVDELKNRPY